VVEELAAGNTPGERKHLASLVLWHRTAPRFRALLVRGMCKKEVATMSRLTFIGLTAMLVLSSSLAFAAEKEAAERAARKACMAGDYATGVGLLADLFVDTKNSTTEPVWVLGRSATNQPCATDVASVSCAC
jgi:hypothetical protein